jgi:DNA-binding MarR family transcriptional regulator
VAAGEGIALTDLASHLGLPKSSASVVVKDLERRGFVHRRRDTADERRLSITLSAAGKRRVAADSVLDPRRLSAALDSLSPDARARLLADLETLATHAELTRPQHTSHR